MEENFETPYDVSSSLRVYSAWISSTEPDVLGFCPGFHLLPELLTKAADIIDRDVIGAEYKKKPIRQVCVGDEIDDKNIRGVVLKRYENGTIVVLWNGGVVGKYGIAAYSGFHLTGRQHPQIVDVLNQLREVV